MAWVTVVGLAAGAGGAFLKGKSGDIVRNRLNSVADTPGLDIEELTSQALSNQSKTLPEAQGLVRSEAVGRQSLVNDLLEQSMPGFAASKGKAQALADSLLAGEVPKEISDLVQRSSAAQALGSGFGGSGMHRNLVARDLGLTGLGLQGQGLQWLQTLRGLSPMVTPANTFNFTGPSTQDLINLRSRERTERMNILTGAAQVPGQTAAWGNYLSSVGGTLTGAGLSGGFGGMGGGGGNGTPGFQGSAGGQQFYNVPVSQGSGGFFNFGSGMGVG